MREPHIERDEGRAHQAARGTHQNKNGHLPHVPPEGIRVISLVVGEKAEVAVRAEARQQKVARIPLGTQGMSYRQGAQRVSSTI